MTQPEIKPDAHLMPASESIPEHLVEMPEVRPEASAAQETLQKTPEGNLDKTIESLSGLLRMKGKPKPQGIPQVKDPLTVNIERIMEEDLVDAFLALDTVKKQEFKIKGEKVAHEIHQLLRKTKVQIKKIFKLILSWLSLLPGVNRFYLEQEAKIKADKIFALKEQFRA